MIKETSKEEIKDGSSPVRTEIGYNLNEESHGVSSLGKKMSIDVEDDYQDNFE